MQPANQLPKQINERLILRRSTRADAGRLGDFFGEVFKNDDGSPETSFKPWVSDLLSPSHPTFQEDDFTLVEDVHSGKIVSAMGLISQTWTYEGIPFGVGRPEAVGTLKEYRNQGLVRIQFDLAHERSQERGELMQGITGIPYYYRRFGYEMCVDLDGGRVGYEASLPVLKAEQKDVYRFRRVEKDDISFVAMLDANHSRRLALTCPRDETLWEYELFGHSEGTDDRMYYWIIENAAGERVGYYFHSTSLDTVNEDKKVLNAFGFELAPGVPYPEVTPLLLQHLFQAGVKIAEDKKEHCHGVGMYMETDHPAMQSAAHWLPTVKDPYAWYIRVPDLPAFIRHIAPALEKRLAESPCAGINRKLEITFYTSKLLLRFEKGRLAEVEQTRFYGDEDCQAGFSGLTFLHVLLGYRTVEELEYIYADCWVKKAERQLFAALFPRRPARIWALS